MPVVVENAMKSLIDLLRFFFGYIQITYLRPLLVNYYLVPGHTNSSKEGKFEYVYKSLVDSTVKFYQQNYLRQNPIYL